MTPVRALSPNVALSATALRRKKGFFAAVLCLGALLILAWGSWRDAAVADTGVADLMAAAAELGVVPVQAAAVAHSGADSAPLASWVAPEPEPEQIAARAYVPVEAPAETTPRPATRRAAPEVEAPPAIVIPSVPETAPVAAPTPSPAVMPEASKPDPVLDAELAAVTSLVAEVIGSVSDAAVSRARWASTFELLATTPVETTAVASAPSPSPLAAASLAPEPMMVTAAATPAPAVSQCNGTDNVGGKAVACDVTVTNNLDLGTGETSSTVTVKECHGAANAALTCTETTTEYDELTTSVDQCNGSGNGGGGTVTCNVNVVNNITVPSTDPLPTVVPATVNQCNESGEGGGTQPTTFCFPFPANTTSAVVDQCNGSGNGGGGTARVRCTVARGSTESSALPVTVDQCNGSGNGGGGYVTCTTSVTNNIRVTPAPGTPDTGTPDTGTPDTGTPDTDTPDADTPPPAVRPGGGPAGGILPGNLPVQTVPLSAFVGGAPMTDALPATSSLLAPTAIAPVRTGAPLASAALVNAGGPSSVLTVASASSSVERLAAQSQTPALALALTGVDTRSMLMVAWFAMALGALAVRMSGPRTIRLRTTGGRRTVR